MHFNLVWYKQKVICRQKENCETNNNQAIQSNINSHMNLITFFFFFFYIYMYSLIVMGKKCLSLAMKSSFKIVHLLLHSTTPAVTLQQCFCVRLSARACYLWLLMHPRAHKQHARGLGRDRNQHRLLIKDKKRKIFRAVFKGFLNMNSQNATAGKLRGGLTEPMYC